MSRWRDGPEEDGFALVSAIGLMMLASLIMLTLLAVSLREATASGYDRQRSSAVSVAEAGLDATLAGIQDADPATLPCGPQTSTVTVGADTMAVTTTVTYYDAGGAVVPCGSLAGSVAAQAAVRSTASAGGIPGQLTATRGVETLVRLTPTYTQALDKAIFGNAGIRLANNGEIFGSDGTANADVYTNGDFDCFNNQRYHGSVFAQGHIYLFNTCTIDVDAWAKTDLQATNSSVISGDVKVSQGNAYLVNQVSVSGKVYAKTVSGEYCSHHPGKCVTSTNLPDPPKVDFPLLKWDAATQAQWASASASQGGPYQIVSLDGDAHYGTCSWVNGSANGPGAWIQDKTAGLTSPTVIVTSCPVYLQNQNKIKLGSNLAVVARGGIRFSNQVTIASTTSALRYLYLIQPADGITLPCTSEGITLDNQVTIDSTVNELIYTPCSVRKANNDTQYGQIYAGGQAEIDNKLTMYYRPLPVWGVLSSSATVKSYAVDVLYKRETSQ